MDEIFTVIYKFFIEKFSPLYLEASSLSELTHLGSEASIYSRLLKKSYPSKNIIINTFIFAIFSQRNLSHQRRECFPRMSYILIKKIKHCYKMYFCPLAIFSIVLKNIIFQLCHQILQLFLNYFVLTLSCIVLYCNKILIKKCEVRCDVKSIFSSLFE